MSLDDKFQEYFEALDRSGDADRCFICRRTPADVKHFFGFDEDGIPLEATEYGLEDVVLEKQDIMSYRAERPICAVCQLNYDAIFLLEDHDVIKRVVHDMEHKRDYLWPQE